MTTTTTPDDSYPESWGYQRGETYEPTTDGGQPISSLESGLANYGTPQDTPSRYPETWGYRT